MNKVLILGSNFGAKVYVRAINKIFKNIEIDIVSPNIKKKKIGFKVNKFSTYVKLIKSKKYDLIICATKPVIQNNFINFFINNLSKNRNARLMLEKPLSENVINIFKNLDNLKKKKIIFNQNFIFPKLDIWKVFSNICKKKKYKIIYDWKFKQAYFINKKQTWKTKKKQGGGILLYYLPHIIFNLLTLEKKIKLTKVYIIKKTKNLITSLRMYFMSKSNEYEVNLDINSKKRIHSLKMSYKNNIIRLENLSKDWTKNFKIIKNKNKIAQSKETRVDLSKKNLEELINYKYNNKDHSNFLNLISKTYNIIKLIQKKTND